MDVRSHNRMAWDRNVERKNRWTIPVSPQAVDAARRGEFEILLTPTKLERKRLVLDDVSRLEFAHTLADQIGGQLDAGLVLTGFYEDIHLEGVKPNDWMPTFGATRAIKT